MSSSNEKQRLLDIVENIDAARGYVGDLDRDEFTRTPIVIDACERCLQRITEAAIKLGEVRFAQIAPTVDFAQLRGMGNMLRHEYDVINARIIYDTVVSDLPPLRLASLKFLDSQSSDDE